MASCDHAAGVGVVAVEIRWFGSGLWWCIGSAQVVGAPGCL